MEKSLKPHKNLLAWQKGMEMTLEVYKLTEQFPKHELYGLTSQIRRAAVAVPSNIAEGAANRTATQFANFLSIAIGSLNELETQLTIAYRLGYMSDHVNEETMQKIDHCLRLTYGLRKSILAKKK